MPRAVRRAVLLAVVAAALTVWLPVGVAYADPPSNGSPPVITGTAQQGVMLNVSDGTWSGEPTFSYEWEDCDSSNDPCTQIDGATSNSYTPQGSDVGDTIIAVVTATNGDGTGTATSANTDPVLPPAPSNSTPPVITGTAQDGNRLNVSQGTWSGDPTFSYQWEDCDGSGDPCTPIGGAISSSYKVQASDAGSAILAVVTGSNSGGRVSASSQETGVVPVPAAPPPPVSRATATALLTSPSAAVTNQTVALVATVYSGAGAAAPSGTLSFENGGVPIGGCANLSAAPSGQSMTVTCSTSFAASTAELSAVFAPGAGSSLTGSSSPTDSLIVSPGSSSTSLDASTSVDVGQSTTYTASVTSLSAGLGPIEPTGTVEFLDNGLPIGSCQSQPLTTGGATCAVSYTGAGAHSITARYLGDSNFTESSSPSEPVSVVAVPVGVLGTITSTMQWTFYYTPSYTRIRALMLNGVPSGATVLLKCHGRGCPFARQAAPIGTIARCGKKSSHMCSTHGTFNLTPGFAKHRLRVGTRLTVTITLPNWIGKYYTFTVRARRGPRIQVGCLAPGSASPGGGC